MFLRVASGFEDDFPARFAVILWLGPGEEDFHHVWIKVVLAVFQTDVDAEAGGGTAQQFQQLVARRGDDDPIMFGNFPLRERLPGATRRGVKSDECTLWKIEGANFGILSRRRDQIAAIEFRMMADDDPEQGGGEGDVETPRR